MTTRGARGTEDDRSADDPRQVDILQLTSEIRGTWSDPFRHEAPDPDGRLIGEMLLRAEIDVKEAAKAVFLADKAVRHGRRAASWTREDSAFDEVCDYFHQCPDAERDRLAGLANKHFKGFWSMLTRTGECMCPLCNFRVRFREAS